VLVEKPAGSAARRSIGRGGGARPELVKVGFNHRFHPAIARRRERPLGRYGESCTCAAATATAGRRL
jgi:hypothetical protein